MATPNRTAPKRRTESMTFGELEIECEELPMRKSEDMLPDIARILTRLADKISVTMGPVGFQALQNLSKIKTEADIRAVINIFVPALVTLADELGGGMLKKLAGPLTTGVTVIGPDPEGGRKTYEFVKESERMELFEAHRDAYFPILFFAGKVTFASFFSVTGLIAKGQTTSD